MAATIHHHAPCIVNQILLIILPVSYISMPQPRLMMRSSFICIVPILTDVPKHEGYLEIVHLRIPLTYRFLKPGVELARCRAHSHMPAGHLLSHIPDTHWNPEGIFMSF
jgi:hypothetical protein